MPLVTGSISGPGTWHHVIRCKHLALNIRCISSLGTPLNVACSISEQLAEIKFPSCNDSMTVCKWSTFFLRRTPFCFCTFSARFFSMNWRCCHDLWSVKQIYETHTFNSFADFALTLSHTQYHWKVKADLTCHACCFLSLFLS